MADQDIDAELLALAGDDSDSDDGSPQPEVPKVKSPSPPPPPRNESPKPQQPTRKKGVAQRTNMKSSRGTATKPRAKLESDDEGEASSAPRSPDSLGSEAMSESESDSEPSPALDANSDIKTMYPIDNLFVSKREKDEINALPEIQREEKIAERAALIERHAQDLSLRRMMQEREKTEAKVAERKRKANSAELDDSPRKTSRPKVKTNDNLEAYKRQREQRNQQRRRDEDRRSTNQRSPSLGRGESEDDADGESDVQWDDGDARGLHGKPLEEPAPSLGMFQAVRTGRSNFATVCFYPDFETTLSGCFCRASVGFNKEANSNIYRMMQIKGFTTGKPYKFENPNNKPIMTDQYAVLLQGKQERIFPFNQCSDSKIIEPEFEDYKRIAEAEGQRIPTNTFLESKRSAIHALVNRSWSEDEINEKLRRSDAAFFAYASMERQRMEKERKIAQANGDLAAVARLDLELTAFDSSKSGAGVNGNSKTAGPKPTTQQDRLAALNRANRKANAEEVRKAQLAEKRAQQRAQAAVARGEAVANPFARVKTTAKVHYDAKGSDTLHAKKINDELFGDSGRSRSVTPMPGNSTPRSDAALQKTEKKKGSKKNLDDEIIASMDLGIDVEI